MDIKRIAAAQVVLFLYLTSESLLNFFVRILLWGVVFLVIFKDRATPKVLKLQEWLINKQQKVLTRINLFFQDLSIARIIKTLLVLKVAIFFTWLLPGWLFFFITVQLWAFKNQIKPYRQQLKEKVKGLGQTVEHQVSGIVKQIPKYVRTNL